MIFQKLFDEGLTTSLPHMSLSGKKPIGRLIHVPRGLVTMCCIMGTYGIGFGLLLIPVGLFVGTHMLYAALAHITIGCGYIASVISIKVNKAWGLSLSLLLSTIVFILSVLAIIALTAENDFIGVLFWAFMCAFVIAIAICALRGMTASSRNDTVALDCSVNDEDPCARESGR